MALLFIDVLVSDRHGTLPLSCPIYKAYGAHLYVENYVEKKTRVCGATLRAMVRNPTYIINHYRSLLCLVKVYAVESNWSCIVIGTAKDDIERND